MNAALFSVFMLAASGATTAEAREQIRLGAVEDVVILPWGVKMPARIDTGAATTSLDARDISVKNNIVEFKLPKQYGGQKIRLPLLRWITIKTSETQTQRPVVMMELCIGSRRVKTHVNLNDRSTVKYPLLIGRNTIKHSFIVDCGTSYCTEPSCSGAYPK